MKCTGIMCPMQHGTVTPEKCELFGNCEFQTPGPLSEIAFEVLGYSLESKVKGDTTFRHCSGKEIVINLNAGCYKWDGPEQLNMSAQEMIACALYVLENAHKEEKNETLA